MIRETDDLLTRRRDSQALRSFANLYHNLIFTHCPDHRDLCIELLSRIEILGGSDLEISGGPRFHQFGRLVGLKLAKRLQKLIGSA